MEPDTNADTSKSILDSDSIISLPDLITEKLLHG